MRKEYIIKNNNHYYSYDGRNLIYDFHYIKNKIRGNGRYKISYSALFPNKLKCIDFRFMLYKRNKKMIRNNHFLKYNYCLATFNSKPQPIKFYKLY